MNDITALPLGKLLEIKQSGRAPRKKTLIRRLLTKGFK